MPIPTIMLIACVAAGAPATQPVQRLMATAFADRETIELTDWQIRPDGFRGLDQQGRDRQLPSADLLAFRQPPLRTSQPVYPRVVLNDGSIISARITQAGDDSAKLILSNDTEIEIETSQLARYEMLPLNKPPSELAAPAVVLANGDVLSSTVRVEDGQVIAMTDFGETEMPMNLVRCILWQKSERHHRNADQQEKTYRIQLHDGQQFFTKTSPESVGATVILQTKLGRVEIDTSEVHWLVWPRARLEQLSNLEFTSEGQTYFGTSVTPRTNTSARGGPLRLGYRVFESGIGTRAEMKLTWSISDNAVWVTGYVGLDPVHGQRGACNVRVLADDQTVFSEDLSNPDEVIPVTIPVNRRKQLQIQVNAGQAGSMGDYVNWCDIVLISRTHELKTSTSPAP